MPDVPSDHQMPCERHTPPQVLSYLDFFPTGVQRVAVSTAANICRAITPDSAGVVQEVVPMLANLLQYQVEPCDAVYYSIATALPSHFVCF